MDKVIKEGTLRLLITESTCDVILSCSDHRLMAHKLVLSIASPVFRELLRNNCADANSCVLILPDVHSTTMSSILDYIYTGTTVVYRHDLAEFLSVAEFLQIVVDNRQSADYIKKQDDLLMDCSGKSTSALKFVPVITEAKCLKSKPQKKLPDLLPLDVGLFRSAQKQKKMSSVVVPSPWCQRDGKSFLGDPRIVSIEKEVQKSFQEDTNNNFQLMHNKESLKQHVPRSLDNVIRQLYLNKPKDSCFVEKLPENRLELPKFTNFPFSRHLTDTLHFSSRYPENPYRQNHNFASPPSEQAVTPSHSPLEAATSKDPPLILNESSNSVQEGVVIDNCCNDTSSSGDSSNDEKKEDNNSTKKKAYKCEDCDKTFSQLRNYKYHRSIHEGTKEFSAKCPECGKTFNDRGYLSSHMKIHRDRKEYACPNCPKRFNQRVAYNMHLRIHTGVKPHECPTCGKSFSRKMLLKQHQRVHTGERPYSCPECGKTFADRSNMSLHARLHTGVKPYACNVCPKSFTKKHHLKTHMNFHTGLKPYTCENCGLAFSQSSNMRTHYKKCILKDRHENDHKIVENLSSADNNSS